jgi:anaerobic selenocysteine-containing dehydrogenase
LSDWKVRGCSGPVRTRTIPGTKFLHKDVFAAARVLFHAITYKPPAEVVDDEYPFWLTTGRVFAHYHTATMTRNCPALDAEVREGFLELNPADADALGVSRKGMRSKSHHVAGN